MPELAPMQRRLTWTVYATPLMTRTTDLGLSIRVSMFKYVRLVTGTSSGGGGERGAIDIGHFDHRGPDCSAVLV